MQPDSKATSNIWQVAAHLLSVAERVFHWSFLLRPIAYFIRENRLIDKCLERQQDSLEKSWSASWMSRSAKRREFTHAVHQVLQVHKQDVDRSKIKRLWREIKKGEGVERIGDFIAKTWVIQKEIKHPQDLEALIQSTDLLDDDPSHQIYTYLKQRLETAFLWWQIQNPKEAERLKGQFVDYRVLEKFELHEDDVLTNFDLLDDQSDKTLWVSESYDFRITVAQAHHLNLQEMYALIEGGVKKS
jgi:hypothetical protein